MEKSEKEQKFNINTNYLVGGRFDNWLHLLWQNKFRVNIKHIPKALYISLVSFIMFFPAMLEKLIYDKKIKEVKMEKAPVFILGHWRSGTTYLFNVLSHDERFTFFDAVSTFTQNNYLLLGKILRNMQAKVLPAKRPMDNIEYTTYVPQEELFAFASKTTEAIIHMTAFPNNAAYYKDMAFTDRLTEKQLKRLEKVYGDTIKKAVFASGGKRILLKSPDNTCRVDMLVKLYPDAKFIHIYRNPYKVIMSTIRLFKTMFPMFNLQDFPSDEFVESFILDLYGEVYTKYFKDRDLIPKGNLIEIKYEDFVKSPMEYLKTIYARLNIDDFECVRAEFDRYINSLGEYKTNNFVLTDDLKKKINSKLGHFIEKFGYDYIE